MVSFNATYFFIIIYSVPEQFGSLRHGNIARSAQLLEAGGPLQDISQVDNEERIGMTFIHPHFRAWQVVGSCIWADVFPVSALRRMSI